MESCHGELIRAQVVAAHAPWWFTHLGYGGSLSPDWSRQGTPGTTSYTYGSIVPVLPYHDHQNIINEEQMLFWTNIVAKNHEKVILPLAFIYCT